MNIKNLSIKLLEFIITLFLVSLVTYIGFELAKSDAATAMAGVDASPERLIQLRSELGLDKPLFIRYYQYITGLFAGNLGMSYVYKQPVSIIIGDKIIITLMMSMIAFFFILLFAFPISIINAKYRNTFIDYVITIVNQVNMSIPPFFLGIIVTFVLGFSLKLFIPGAYIDYQVDFYGFLSYIIFPAITIAIPRCAMTIKLLTNSILAERRNDYVRTAISKGNSDFRVLYKHIMKNAIMPVITFLGMLPASMIASSIVVEQVFGVPGIGRLLISSISNRDFPTAQAIILFIASIVITLNFLVDILYQIVDPRIRIKR